MKKIKWLFGSETTIEKIKIVESNLGIKFPKSYIEVILKNNGASPKPALFEGKEGSSGISGFIKIDEIEYNKNLYDEIFNQDIPENHEDLKRYKSLVPFAFDPGDAHLCFDYYQREDPAIIFLTDVYDIHLIADSFEEFLDLLYEPENGDLE